MDQLLKILSSIRPDVDFVNQKALIDDGIIDSFDIVALVSELSTTFDIEINVEHLTPENFNSVDAMMRLIEHLQNEI